MGKIKNKLIKKISLRIFNSKKINFENFYENKKFVKNFFDNEKRIPKKMINIISGYLKKLQKKEAHMG